MLVLFGATVSAQQRSPIPPGTESPRLLDLLNLLEAQQRTPGTRGGGGRGPVDDGIQDQMRELERFINRAGGPVVVSVVSGAWWNNAILMSQLGLTEDQKAKIMKSFENHRLTLESNKASLEKEEAQLARLLEADSVDRNAAIAQIYRVVNARSEMERTNATMSLEMREHLTRAQWTQLQAQSNATMKITPPASRGTAKP
jgi:Spy/CpxP family protein refolding chaperone